MEGWVDMDRLQGQLWMYNYIDQLYEWKNGWIAIHIVWMDEWQYTEDGRMAIKKEGQMDMDRLDGQLYGWITIWFS